MVASRSPVSYILKTSVTLSSSSFESCWVAGLLAEAFCSECLGDLEDMVMCVSFNWQEDRKNPEKPTNILRVLHLEEV